MIQGRNAGSVGDHPLLRLQPGEYAKHEGVWYFCPPWPNGGGCLAKHTVVEHEDGTITVSPSILLKAWSEEKNVMEEWHGFLERGVWRVV